MIRIDSIWLANEPMDMRAGTETALAKVIAVFGAAQPHCAYLFANRRANRMKVLMGKTINRDQTVIEKLTHEIAQLKRLKFAKRSEQMNPEQASLLDDLIDTDIAAIEAELQALQTVPAATEKKAETQAHYITG